MKKIFLLLLILPVFGFVLLAPRSASAANTYQYNKDQTKITATIGSKKYTLKKYKTEAQGNGATVYFHQTSPTIAVNKNFYEIKMLTSMNGSQHYIEKRIYRGSTNTTPEVVTAWAPITVKDYEGTPVDKQPAADPAGDTPGTTGTTDTTDSESKDSDFGYQPGSEEEKSNLDQKPFKTVFGVECTTYECWISEVWKWALIIILPLSVTILIAAGILYMTSEGDSNRVALAKKFIIGVASGIAILVLGRFLISVLLGSTGVSTWWKI